MFHVIVGKILNSSHFWFSGEFQVVIVHPPYKNLVLKISELVSVDRMVLVVKSYVQCICFTVGVLKKELFGKRCWRTTF